MKTKNNGTGKGLSEKIGSSKMWVVINIDEDGFHYQASQHDEGLVLMALALSSRTEDWELMKEYVTNVRNRRQAKLN